MKRQIRSLEDWWFDSTRHIVTRGDEPPADVASLAADARDAHPYIPVRPANARDALSELPLSDFSRYTFIDMGSGKGRMLFVAAERPFKKVVGVEFAGNLHEIARENVWRRNRHQQKCGEIEPVQADAAAFEFPAGNLVVYIFNPFGPDIFARMMANLNLSLQQSPRHAVLLMLYPNPIHTLEQMPNWRAHKQTRRFHIYQSGDA